MKVYFVMSKSAE